MKWGHGKHKEIHNYSGDHEIFIISPRGGNIVETYVYLDHVIICGDDRDYVVIYCGSLKGEQLINKNLIEFQLKRDILTYYGIFKNNPLVKIIYKS